MAIIKHFDPNSSLHMLDDWLDFLQTPAMNTVLSRTTTQWVIQGPNGYTYVLNGVNFSTAATDLPTVGVARNIYYFDTATGALAGSVTNFSVNAQNLSRSAITSGIDEIHSSQHADVLYGNTGADVFVVIHASDYNVGDIILGGGGIDTLRFTTSTNGDMLIVNDEMSGVEKIHVSTLSGAGTGTVSANIDASAATYGLELRGNDGANTLTGTGFADQIAGRAGNDSISAGSGNDIINGGLGDDVMSGGIGQDIFVISEFVENYTNGPGDSILDFTIGQDKIDLSALEAIEGDPGSSFNLSNGMGLGTVSLEAGPNPGDVKVVIAPDANINDFMVINVHITNGSTLTASDFIL